MQIKNLIFYNSIGEKRILSFEMGKVNIITGESKTGKTALIDIVNYCLCSDDCKISEGIIRDTVEWFAILLQLEAEQVFIARRNPNKINQASTQHIYFQNADIVEIPELLDLYNNSDVDSLKDFFTKKLYISEFINSSEEGTRAAVSVNFKHARFYSYQPQDLIAQRNYLFYNQSEPFIPQTIKDTLPYFLGAIREDTFRIEQEISKKKRALAKLEKEFVDYQRLNNDGSKKVFELIDEAKQLNLLSAEQIIDSPAQAMLALREVLLWENNQMTVWAPKLDLEHQNAPIRFDLKKLTIFADTPKKSIPLSNMGSGANWLACHLLIHFALHKHFINAQRPVPRFLILDQPSQIYFPPEKDIDQTGEIQESSDETEVKRIYEFIFNVTKELTPHLQVIITDHAKLNSDEFSDATIEEWRNGLKLIPTEWAID